jgi:hypothetical protein
MMRSSCGAAVETLSTLPIVVVVQYH